MVRAILTDLNISLWVEAYNTACCLKKRLLHSQLAKDVTSYEALLGSIPSIHHFQLFGRDYSVHIHKDS